MLKLLFSFQGRIDRTTYVVFFLASIALAIVNHLLIPAKPAPSLFLPLLIYGVAQLWVALAMGAKRLHDLGHSGWLQLLWLVSLVMSAIGSVLAAFSPLLGLPIFLLALAISLWSLWLLVQMLFFAGQPGTNDYGDHPNLEAFEAGLPDMQVPAAALQRVAAAAPQAPAADRRVKTTPHPLIQPDRRRPQGFGRRAPV
jgi:uncharacterized membrane protein YhaH (DUF805 family)